VGRELLLRPRRGETLASVFIAFIATGLIVLVYNLDPIRNWTLLVGVWAGSDFVILYLLQNQRQNEKEFQKHPVSFPNPEGGGILGEYVNRPWQNDRRNRTTLPKQESEEAQEGRLGRGLTRDQESSRHREPSAHTNPSAS
jgi:hypothetical protein